MTKIENMKITEIAYKIKMAKLLVALNDNIRDGAVVDTMFMGSQETSPNETVYDFIMSELEDVIDFEFDADNNYLADIILAEKFILDSTSFVKRKMGI